MSDALALVPPFTMETAKAKVRKAEDGWNSRNPAQVSLAYTVDSKWRNRAEFVNGREEIVAFLTRKWEREQEYRLIKELWGFKENRMAVRFCYEWHDAEGQWFRSYGNELWEFDEAGLMRVCVMRVSMTWRSARRIGCFFGRSGRGRWIMLGCRSGGCKKQGVTGIKKDQSGIKADRAGASGWRERLVGERPGAKAYFLLSVDRGAEAPL